MVPIVREWQLRGKTSLGMNAAGAETWAKASRMLGEANGVSIICPAHPRSREHVMYGMLRKGLA
eukprot:9215506-Pyramimonas_sp.AAC.1